MIRFDDEASGLVDEGGTRLRVRALPAAEFAEWATATRGKGRALDGAAYTALMKQSIADPPALYGAVEDGLFEKIVDLGLSHGPGPALEHHGAKEK